MVLDDNAPVAIVTAASRGIGAACARELAKRGYRLSLSSSSVASVKLAEELGGLGLQCSLTESNDIRSMVEETLSYYGRIDAAVLNTGHAPRSQGDGTSAASQGSGPAYDPNCSIDLTAISDDEWLSGVDMLLLSVCRLLREIVPVMEKQGHGAIVSISTFGAREPRMTYPVSSVVRASLSALTKLYADRYGRSGIRFNNVLPGFFDNHEQPEQVVRSIPLNRLGRLEEVAKTVAFLMSDDAGYITGKDFVVDGGIGRSA